MYVVMLFFLAACNGVEVVSVVGATINENNGLVFELSNGEEINVGIVVGDDGIVGERGPQGIPGVDGVGIKSIELDENGELVVTLTDEKEINLGVIKGKYGDKGEPGLDGKDGLSAYEIYKKYYPAYPGDEKEWIDDLAKGDLVLFVDSLAAWWSFWRWWNWFLYPCK